MLRNYLKVAWRNLRLHYSRALMNTIDRSVGIMLLTASSQAIKAAVMNPVKSLRSE